MQIVVTPEALDLLESLDPSGHLPDSGAAVVRDRKIVENVDLEPGFPDPARQIDVIEEDRKAFVERGWKELPGSYVTDQSASAMFARNGFVVALSVIPFQETGLSCQRR